MNYTELFIAIGLLILSTIIYIALQKFIKWTVDDDKRFRKKNGNLGLSHESYEVNKKVSLDKLFFGYISIIVLLVIYIIKLMVDTI